MIGLDAGVLKGRLYF